MEELRLIEEIRKRAGSPGKGVRAGIGDDCAVLGHDSRRYLLWGADMLVEGTHFRVKETGYRKIGRKAVAVNISDIAAMGGVPAYITAAVGIPPRMKRTAVGAVYDGIFGICEDYGIRVIGGDTNRSDRLIISVSIIGFVEKKRLIRRNGAREGDLILVTGPVRDGRRNHLDFVPRLKEARFLSARYRIHSMIDVSDGIAPDLGRICAESGLGCKVYAGSIPLSRGLTLDEALYYGESFELLFTMSAPESRRLFLDMRSGGRDPLYFIIGEMSRKSGGLRLIRDEGRSVAMKTEGYRHL